MAKPQTKRLSSSRVRIDGETQVRVKLDADTVQGYFDAIEAGAKFPPVVVFFDGSFYWLADGFHRWHAHRKTKASRITCEVHKGTQHDALWYAIGANQTHGLPRSNRDKANAVKSALKHPNGAKMSDRQIAEHVGVSNHFVAKQRRSLQATGNIPSEKERTGRDGRTINTANIGKRNGVEPAEEAVEDDPPAQTVAARPAEVRAERPPPEVGDEPDECQPEEKPGTLAEIARAENGLNAAITEAVRQCWNKPGGFDVDVPRLLRELADEYEENSG